MIDDLLAEFDIESGEDFIYFEQFSALMEAPFDIDYDTFVEIMLMPSKDALKEMTESFFEDLIKGIPDDNTELYAAVQSVRDAAVSLAASPDHRGRGFYAEELFRFRQWYTAQAGVKCTPEAGGEALYVTPLEALMLFRAEKLAGEKYDYDFSCCMLAEPDEYTLDIISEFSGDNFSDSFDIERDEYEELERELPVELPADFDAENYDPENASDLLGPIDPYTDGFVDRYHPVIEGLGVNNDDDDDDGGQSDY